MEVNNSLTLNLSEKQTKDLKRFCTLNELDIDEFVAFCFKKGYYIEKYGSLNENESEAFLNQKIEELTIELEREKNKPAKIEYVEVEVEKVKIVEKEIPVEIEKIVEKEIKIIDEDELNELKERLDILEDENDKLKIEVKKYEDDNQQTTRLTNQEINALQEKINSLKKEIVFKDREIENLSMKIEDLEDLARTKVKFLRKSNLKDNI